VLVQPFAEFVTVNVYVPTLHTVGFWSAEVNHHGPDQLKPVPPVVAPDITMHVDAQVNVPPVALAPGGVLFSLTPAVAVLVQPFAEFVTVSVYVPDAHTCGFCTVEVK